MSKFESWLELQNRERQKGKDLERCLIEPRSYAFEKASDESVNALWNSLQVEDFAQITPFLSSCKIVVEFGLGAGLFSAKLAQELSAASVTCVSRWPNLCAALLEKGQGLLSTTIVEGSLGPTTILKDSVDLIVVHQDEHALDDIQLLLKEAHRILRSNGKIVFISQTLITDEVWKKLAHEVTDLSCQRLEKGDFSSHDDMVSLEEIVVTTGKTNRFSTVKYWAYLLDASFFTSLFIQITDPMYPECKRTHVVGTRKECDQVQACRVSRADRNIVRTVLPFTMTPPERILCLIQAIEHLHQERVSGSIVECGVWKGGSMMTAALTLLRLSDCERDLYLFDTFDGMSEPTHRDVDSEGKSASLILLEERKDKRNHYWAYSPLEDVKANMRQTFYPSQKIHYIQGKVEDTLPGAATGDIALLRLDTDWYESTYHELVHLYPRLKSGGILILDDYGFWKGAQQAVDQYFSEIQNPPTLYEIDSIARYATKP
jgi:O-methyltransferase